MIDSPKLQPVAKKLYSPPKLICHGDVRSLTQSGSNRIKAEGPGVGNSGPDRNRP